MNFPGNTAKLGATHSNIQTAQRGRPWLGTNLQCISQHTTESALYPLYMPARHKKENSRSVVKTLNTGLPQGAVSSPYLPI